MTPVPNCDKLIPPLLTEGYPVYFVDSLGRQGKSGKRSIARRRHGEKMLVQKPAQ